MNLQQAYNIFAGFIHLVGQMTHSDLIYDIGAHQGDDTGWYLQQGYRVVAVEANPRLANELKRKFNLAIATGKLTVVNAAVAEKDNETVTFFISREDWRSSTIKDLAERDGVIVETTTMPTARLSTLFEQYGAPFYCKIDIEGNDAMAIKSLGNTGRPQYISCELSCLSISDLHKNNNLLFDTLNALQTAGYTSFQLIDQESLLQLSAERHYGRLYSFYSRVRTKIERLTGLYTSRYSNRFLIARKRKVNSDFVTAPFGESLTGKFTDYETTRNLIRFHFNDYYTHTQNKLLTFWVDIHATL
jgi:FkbM family methyltransferase